MRHLISHQECIEPFGKGVRAGSQQEPAFRLQHGAGAGQDAETSAAEGILGPPLQNFMQLPDFGAFFSGPEPDQKQHRSKQQHQDREAGFLRQKANQHDSDQHSERQLAGEYVDREEQINRGRQGKQQETGIQERNNFDFMRRNCP